MTLHDLVTRCNDLGVMLLDDHDSLSIDAPCGKVFASSGLHSTTLNLEGWKRPDAYRMLFIELGGGLDDCSDSDCDACVHELMSFEDIHMLYGGSRLA